MVTGHWSLMTSENMRGLVEAGIVGTVVEELSLHLPSSGTLLHNLTRIHTSA